MLKIPSEWEIWAGAGRGGEALVTLFLIFEP